MEANMDENPIKVELVENHELVRLQEVLDSLEKDQYFKSKFEVLMQTMYDIAKMKGWHSPSKSFTEQLMMMVSEAVEANEEYRKENGDVNEVWYNNERMEYINGDNTLKIGIPKPEGVSIELADLLIRLFDTCTLYRINILDKVIEKSHFNLHRPFRHGKKKV